MELFVNICHSLSMFVFTVGIIGFIVWDNVTLSRCGWRGMAAGQDQVPERAQEVAASVVQIKGVPSH